MGPSFRVSADHPLRTYFSTLAEKNFYEQLGWPDQRVIRYVADLLTEFSDVDRVYLFQDAGGVRRSLVSDMLLDAESGAGGVSERDAHRQIGDFTLFMMGLFPEQLTRLKAHRVFAGGDFLLDYIKVGKRSYRIVSQLPDGGEDTRDEAALLFRKLSEEFELCVAGLGCIREDIRRRPDGPFDRFRERFLN